MTSAVTYCLLFFCNLNNESNFTVLAHEQANEAVVYVCVGKKEEEEEMNRSVDGNLIIEE